MKFRPDFVHTLPILEFAAKVIFVRIKLVFKLLFPKLKTTHHITSPGRAGRKVDSKLQDGNFTNPSSLTRALL